MENGFVPSAKLKLYKLLEEPSRVRNVKQMVKLEKDKRQSDRSEGKGKEVTTQK